MLYLQTTNKGSNGNPFIKQAKEVGLQHQCKKSTCSQGNRDSIKTVQFFCNGPYKLVLHYTRLERPARDEGSNLFGPFISYEKMKRCGYGLIKTIIYVQIKKK
jgi:hypothetical protein